MLCIRAVLQVLGVALVLWAGARIADQPDVSVNCLSRGAAHLPSACSVWASPTRDVIFLVDALRPDMLWNASLFPRVAELNADGRVWHRTMLASSPTVTLPRLRTIVEGRQLDSFLDLFRNVYASTEATRVSAGAVVHCSDPSSRDNLLSYLTCIDDKRPREAQRSPTGVTEGWARRVAFCGDDTWLRLFPPPAEGHTAPHVFAQSRGVASFDVHDSSMVDTVVTDCARAVLASVVARQSVDLVVLHYLGLDHIGHTEDPRSFSGKLRRKCDEMDRRIDEFLHAVCEVHPDSTVTVLSDHGMASGGGHGGASLLERQTVFATFRCRRLEPDALEWERREVAVGSVFLQVDVGDMLLLSLARRPLVCTASGAGLARSQGAVSPSFVAASCGGAVAATEGEHLLSLLAARADHTAPSPMQEGFLATCTSFVTLAVGVALLALGTSWGCEPCFPSFAVVVLSAAEGLLLFGSSFAEEIWFVRASLSAACIVFLALGSRSARTRWLLLSVALVRRVSSTSLFASGEKWKTFAAQAALSTRTDASWRTLSAVLHDHADRLPDWAAEIESRTCMLRVIGEAVSAEWATVYFWCVLAGSAFASPKHRWKWTLLLSGAVLPLGPLHVLNVALLITSGAFFAVAMKTEDRLSPRWRSAVLPLFHDGIACAFGRSLSVGDVSFAHLMSGGSSSPVVLATWAVAGMLWWCAPHLAWAVGSSIVGGDDRAMRKRYLGVTLRRCTLCATAAAAALLLRGHLFSWSVFMPSMLFHYADLLCGCLVEWLVFRE